MQSKREIYSPNTGVYFGFWRICTSASVGESISYALLSGRTSHCRHCSGLAFCVLHTQHVCGGGEEVEKDEGRMRRWHQCQGALHYDELDQREPFDIRITCVLERLCQCAGPPRPFSDICKSQRCETLAGRNAHNFRRSLERLGSGGASFCMRAHACEFECDPTAFPISHISYDPPPSHATRRVSDAATTTVR